MRAIRKQSEPKSLTEYRSSGNPNFVPDYDGYPNKGDLRKSLVEEQGGICCYCMQRIHPREESMKIEHWHSREGYPEEQLDYGNLLGACSGGRGQPPQLQHCDTRKANQDLSRNPANPKHRIGAFISFLADGSVQSADPVFNAQLTDVLNLNLERLKRNRKAALDAFKQTLEGRGALSKAELERKARAFSTQSNGYLPEYCEVVLYWLRKRSARP